MRMGHGLILIVPILFAIFEAYRYRVERRKLREANTELNRQARRLGVRNHELEMAKDAANDLLNFLRAPNVKGLKQEVREAISRHLSTTWELVIPEKTAPQKEAFSVRSSGWHEPLDQTRLTLCNGRAYLILPLFAATGITEEVEIKLNQIAEWAEDVLVWTRVAEIDLQTGLASKNHTLDVLESEFEKAKAYYPHYQLSLVVFDIDDFKSVNDQYGHIMGDEVIERIARIMERHHKQDRGHLTGRIGRGDEFLFILPLTSRKEAIRFAENVRLAIAEECFSVGRQKFGVTASFGIATFRPSCRNFQQLLRMADKALYRSKANGRNQVCSL